VSIFNPGNVKFGLKDPELIVGGTYIFQGWNRLKEFPSIGLIPLSLINTQSNK
jgi:hypothetical protein